MRSAERFLNKLARPVVTIWKQFDSIRFDSISNRIFRIESNRIEFSRPWNRFQIDNFKSNRFQIVKFEGLKSWNRFEIGLEKLKSISDRFFRAPRSAGKHSTPAQRHCPARTLSTVLALSYFGQEFWAHCIIAIFAFNIKDRVEAQVSLSQLQYKLYTKVHLHYNTFLL